MVNTEAYTKPQSRHQNTPLPKAQWPFQERGTKIMNSQSGKDKGKGRLLNMTGQLGSATAVVACIKPAQQGQATQHSSTKGVRGWQVLIPTRKLLTVVGFLGRVALRTWLLVGPQFSSGHPWLYNSTNWTLSFVWFCLVFKKGHEAGKAWEGVGGCGRVKVHLGGVTEWSRAGVGSHIWYLLLFCGL